MSDGRIRRNRPNMGAKGDYPPVKFFHPIEHFIPIVGRNIDLYSFIAGKDYTIEELFIHVTSMNGIDSFLLEMYLYDGVDFVRRIFEIKEGHNNFEDGSSRIRKGEIVRFDIQGIDDVYDKLGPVTMNLMLSYKVKI